MIRSKVINKEPGVNEYEQLYLKGRVNMKAVTKGRKGFKRQ